MVQMTNIILSCLLLVATNKAIAQTSADFDLVANSFSVPAPQPLTRRYTESLQNPNELQAVLSGLFLLYKSCISSQDRDGRCMYTPSCSEYGLLAVKKLGILRGGISTIDRLTRCNGVSAPENYEVDIQTKRLLDPVRW
jgi:uncharacterized protein